MALTSSLFIKKSTVSGTVPTLSEITSSELAINLGDGHLYYRNVTSSVVELINVGSASFAETASFALNAGGGGGGAFGGDFSGSFSGSVTGTFIGDGAALFGVSASDVAFADVRDKPTLVSASVQIDHDTTTNFDTAEHFLQSAITEVGIVTTGDVDAILPTGIFSSSVQISGQLDVTGVTGSFTGSYVGDGSGLIGLIADSAVTASDVAYDDVRDKPTLVSASIQIDHDATTNFVGGEHFLQSAITEVGTVTTGNVTAILPNGIVSSSLQFDSSDDFTVGSLTGNFTGSLEATGTLTGTLVGSASFAENASTAVLAVSAVTATTASNANTASFADPLLFTAFRPIQTIANTNPYNVSFTDYLLLIDASSGTLPIDVVLPDTADFMKDAAGKEVTITKIDAGANNVQIMGSGSQTIIGDATTSLTDQYQGLTLLPSGNVWWVK